MREILGNNGWCFESSCKVCGGNAETWANPNIEGYKIKISSKSGYFLVIRNNRKVKKGSITELQSTLNELKN